MARIASLNARKILDSRGEWTIEVSARAADGTAASASVPQGKSTGSHEAATVPPDRAVENVRAIIAPVLVGLDPAHQNDIDAKLIALDGTPSKTNLGANATLGVSLACARLAARAEGLPLWRHFRELAGKKGAPSRIPRLYINVINGGLHAGNNLDFQEYLIIPDAASFTSAVAWGVGCYAALKERLVGAFGRSAGNLGDEGGFAPDFRDTDEPFEIMASVVSGLGLSGKVRFGLDAAATSAKVSTEELTARYRQMREKYDLYYLEDPYGEDDFDNFAKLAAVLGDACAVTGDDLTTTNISRMERARESKSVNGIIIKPNQIGTLTETLNAITKAQEWGWRTVVSHRSGETNDDAIADLAYGIEADGIKLGAPARGERIAKYNRLLQIEQEARA